MSVLWIPTEAKMLYIFYRLGTCLYTSTIVIRDTCVYSRTRFVGRRASSWVVGRVFISYAINVSMLGSLHWEFFFLSSIKYIWISTQNDKNAVSNICKNIVYNSMYYTNDNICLECFNALVNCKLYIIFLNKL